ncbi:hypothetical protein [Peribacillus frigoritolerans]|uniref:Uncharacterized protein n=1 Tax=Peribacillus castrilensis TaxID=2897690 RepID=A0AAW9NKU7_9BACI|nr:hypothetical protein [Peribacillus castrilensis]
MAGQFTRWQMAYKIADTDGIPLYRIVKLTAEATVGKTTADNEVPQGVIDNDSREDIPYQASGSQTGRHIAVKLDGIALVELATPVAFGERVVSAPGGFGKAASALTAGTKANVLGFAEVAGEAGDVVPVRLAYHVYTV